jgi:hypothetical protein
MANSPWERKTLEVRRAEMQGEGLSRLWNAPHLLQNARTPLPQRNPNQNRPVGVGFRGNDRSHHLFCAELAKIEVAGGIAGGRNLDYCPVFTLLIVRPNLCLRWNCCRFTRSLPLAEWAALSVGERRRQQCTLTFFPWIGNGTQRPPRNHSAAMPYPLPRQVNAEPHHGMSTGMASTGL